MEQFSKYFTQLNWETLGIHAVRIILITVGVWIALAILKGLILLLADY